MLYYLGRRFVIMNDSQDQKHETRETLDSSKAYQPLRIKVSRSLDISGCVKLPFTQGWHFIKRESLIRNMFLEPSVQ